MMHNMKNNYYKIILLIIAAIFMLIAIYNLP